MSQLFKWLSILGRLSDVYANQQLKKLNISSNHQVFIIYICMNPGVTQDKLKVLMFVHPSNITRSLDYLEKEGFLTREPFAGDKRTSRLFPAEKAHEAFATIKRVMADWENLLTEQMTKEQKEEFIALLKLAGGKASEYFYG